jgi:hypothetical protein
MSNLPIASLFVRDAMEHQFERRPAAQRRPAAISRGVPRTTAAGGARPATAGRGAAPRVAAAATDSSAARPAGATASSARPARATGSFAARPADARFALRPGAARTLRRLADRLEPPQLSPGAVPRAHPAGRRDSPC